LDFDLGIRAEDYCLMGLGNTGLSILAFIVVIGPLIFIHELGHFLAARWRGVKVEEFGIGFPPRMVTLFEQGGTKFTFNWLPLGGFMRPAGENDPSVEGGLAASSRTTRLAVLAAGPVANFIIAFVLLIGMFMIGAPVELPEGAVVTQVVPDSPADSAGLQVGDTIIKAGDTPIEWYTDLRPFILDHIGTPITLTVRRGESVLDFNITPRTEWPEDQGPIGIGMTPVVEVRQFGFFRAFGRAVTAVFDLFKAFVEIPAAVIQQQIPARYLRPVSIVGISQIGGQAIDESFTQQAAWPVIQLTAFISIALGITNLLPLPALDGGRILFVVIEALRGKRVDPKRETLVHLVGFAILLTAMVLFVYLDIVDPLVELH
jgi:regulator of sigma E protease